MPVNTETILKMYVQTCVYCLINYYRCSVNKLSHWQNVRNTNEKT